MPDTHGYEYMNAEDRPEPDQGWHNYISDVEHLHMLAEDECNRLRYAIRSHRRENTYVTNEDAVLYATLDGDERLPDAVLPANVQRVLREGIGPHARAGQDSMKGEKAK